MDITTQPLVLLKKTKPGLLRIQRAGAHYLPPYATAGDLLHYANKLNENTNRTVVLNMNLCTQGKQSDYVLFNSIIARSLETSFLVCLYAMTNQRLLLEEVEKKIADKMKRKYSKLVFAQR